MPKIKAAVNRILKFGILPVALCYAASPLFARKDSYILAEYNAGFQIVEQANAKQLAPVGSLLKPFAAWYLLENGLNPQQEVLCPPVKKRSTGLRCWTPEGHGPLKLQGALVQSCNYYFLSQFLGRNLGEYEAWLRARFDWPENLPMAKPVNVYGYDLVHGIEPEKLLAMYTKLLQAAESGNKNADVITQGLKDICMGTLADFCLRLSKNPHYKMILGKTGTVQEGKRNFGVVMLFLEHIPQNKKILLLCYEKDRMGSQAALNALKILDAYNRKSRAGKNHNR